MNRLVEVLSKKKFPVLFRLDDIYKIKMKKKEINLNFQEALKNEYIKKIYGDIYTLGFDYRKMLIHEGVIAQMIEPDSYISMSYALRSVNWIPEAVNNIVSVTNGEKRTVRTEYGCSYKYVKIYEKYPFAGIYEEETKMGNFKMAKPLRALCDYIHEFGFKWRSVGLLEDHLRIWTSTLEEDLKAEDFDELQGKFEIENIELFLSSIRKDLRL